MSVDTLYRIAGLVAHVREPEDIYAAAVDAMVAATGADRASLLLFEEAGVVRFKAWHGLSDGYREAVEGHSPWMPDTKEPVPILIPDVATDTSLRPLRDVVLNEGIRALEAISATPGAPCPEKEAPSLMTPIGGSSASRLA